MSDSYAQPIAPDPESETSALDKCLAEKHSLSALFLIDTSGSLQDSDPSNQRVAGLQAAVGALSSLRDSYERQGDGFEVFVDFLSFGSKTYRTYGPYRAQWDRLESDPTGLIESLTTFEGKNRARDTDYVAALEPYIDRAQTPPGEVGALQMLEAAPAESCRLVLWFTDGQFKLNYQGTPKTLYWADPSIVIRDAATARAAMASGIERLCAAGGLADRLRTGDISSGSGAELAVVALGIDVGRTEFDLISGIATGSMESGPCGVEKSRGEIFTSSTIGDLILSLVDGVLGPDDGSGDGDDGIPSCSSNCDDYGGIQPFDYSFTLVPGISAFHLLTIAGDPSVSATLIAPDGEKYRLDAAGAATLSNGVAINVRAIPANAGAYQVDAVMPTDSDQWVGQWRVRFITSDPRNAAEKLNLASFYVFGGDLRVRLREVPTVVRKGTTGRVALELVTSGGILAAVPGGSSDVELAPFPELRLKVAGVEVAAIVDEEVGGWYFDYTPPSTGGIESVDVVGSLTAYLQVAPSAPVIKIADFEDELIGHLELREPAMFPVLDAPIGPFDRSLDQHTSAVRAQLVADATAPESGGCLGLVAVDPPQYHDVDLTLRVFDGATELVLGDDCAVEVPQGTIRPLTIEVAMDGSLVGAEQRSTALGCSVTLKSTSAINPAEGQTFEKECRLAVVPLVTTEIDWVKVLAYTLLALLFPLLILYFVNFFSAKLTIGPVGLLSLPVTLTDGMLSGPDRSTPSLVDDQIVVIGLPEPGLHRSVDLGTTQIGAHVPRSPFADVYARAEVPGAEFVTSNRGSESLTRGRLDLAISDAWVFHAPSVPMRSSDERVEPLDGQLVMLVPQDPDAARRWVNSQLGRIGSQISDAAQQFALDPPQPNIPPNEPDDEFGPEPLPDPLAETKLARSSSPAGDPLAPRPNPDTLDTGASERVSRRGAWPFARHRADEPPTPPTEEPIQPF